MISHPCRFSPSRLPLARSLGSALLACVFVAGCAVPLQVTTNPPGATAYINNKSAGVTPLQVAVEGDKPVPVEFQLNGYFPEAFTFRPGPNQHDLNVRLEPKTLAKTYGITSTPDGAAASMALDVFEPEPPDLSLPLFQDERVIVTPHAAFVSRESLIELRTRVACQIADMLSGRRPENVVNPHVFD
jgi:hypothetical protein